MKRKKKKRNDFVIDDEEDFDGEADYNPNKVAPPPQSKLKAKKRKLKKKSESKKKRRKKNPITTQRKRRGLTPEIEDDGKKNPEEDDFKSIVDHLKTQSKGRSSDVDEGLSADESKQLLKAMTDAARLDREAMDKNEIPIFRILLLPELKKKASQLYLQLALIEEGIMEVLADWLVPYKGKLCSLEVRTAVLDLLLSFPIEGVDKEKLSLLGDSVTYGGITLNKLKKSNIGQMVSFLSQQTEETPLNRKKCKILIEKFSRLIHGLGDSYEDDMERMKREGVTRMQTQVKFAGNPDLEPGAIGFIPRATIPRVVGYDFIKKPSKSKSMREKEEANSEEDAQRSSVAKEIMEKQMALISKSGRSNSSKYNR